MSPVRRERGLPSAIGAGVFSAPDDPAKWPLFRRLVYFGGSVLVPLMRVVRTRAAIAHARRGRDLPRGTVAAVVGGSLLWALGEAMGYIAGEGRSESRMLEYELHKERYA